MTEHKIPIVKANVTLLPELSHGRRLLSTGQYRPHVVIGPESQRSAIRDPSTNAYTETLHAVMFVGGPDAMEPGETAEVSLALMWYPEDTYDEVIPGATFTIREGSLIVGFGRILADPREWTTLPFRQNTSELAALGGSMPELKVAPRHRPK